MHLPSSMGRRLNHGDFILSGGQFGTDRDLGQRILGPAVGPVASPTPADEIRTDEAVSAAAVFLSGFAFALEGHHYEAHATLPHGDRIE
jgi:hypothetical protein